MGAKRSLVSAVTALALFVQATGLAHAAPPPPPGSALPAPAPPGGDAIYLKDGGTLRGQLIEMLPNDHATIRLPTGQNAIAPWSNIERIERPFAQAPPPGSFLPAPLTGSAFVHVAADSGVTLESIAPGEQWTLACTAPCDAELPLGNQYRISGSSVRRSRPFAITAIPGQHAVITVSAGSKRRFAGGVALLSVGAAAAAVGLFVFAIGATECSDGGVVVCVDGYAPNSGLVLAGAITLLAGVGTLLGGVALLSDSRTRETQTFAALAPATRPDTAWLRAPMWREAARNTPGLPKALGFPIFSRSF
jgi:hypothetical protein